MQEAAGRPGTLRVEKMFEDCRKEGRTALLVYLCGGYPDLEYSEELIHAVLEGGADLVEIGMPFSDPPCRRACNSDRSSGSLGCRNNPQ